MSIEIPGHLSDSYLSIIIGNNFSIVGVRSWDDIERASRATEIDIEYRTPVIHHSDDVIPSGTEFVNGVVIKHARWHVGCFD